MQPRSLVETTGLIVAGVLLGAGLATLSSRDAPSAHAPKEGSVALDAEGMAAAVKEGIHIPTHLERAQALDRALAALDAENSAAARDALAASLARIDHCEIGPFTDALARIDPAVAFETSLNWKEAGLRQIAVNRSSYHWALAGGGLAAEHAIQALYDPDIPYLGHMGIARGMVERGDTRAANQFLARVPVERRGFLISTVASWLLAAEGPDALFAWAEAMPDDPNPKLKADVMNTALVQVAPLDPVKAAAWFEAQPTSAAGAPSLTLLLQAWAIQDPDAMLAWVRNRAVTPEVHQAFRDMILNWRARDAESARAWLQKQNREVLAQMGQKATR